jgi:uncharacterized protein YcaQ
VRRTLRRDQARRIALAAQGFDRPRPSGRIDIRHLRRVIGHVDVLQIDAVQAVERAQYLPLFSRLGPYPRALLDDAAYRRRELYEAWAHEASLVRMERWPLLQGHGHHWASRRAERLERERPCLLQRVLDEVAAHGPLAAGDLSDPGERTGTWWGWSPGKSALEVLFIRRQVAVAQRRGQTRVYDLAERVIPAGVLELPVADTQTAYRELLCIAARAMGVATADDLIDYYRLHGPTARSLLADLVGEGRLHEVNVEGWPPAYCWPDARLARRIEAAALLAPFDPVVWYRPRVERLFDFHYRLELYVPAERRQYGYYVMPFLLDGELVARVDVKADRRNGVLRVLGAFVEDGGEPSRVAGPLLGELHELAAWIGLPEVQVGARGSLGSALAVTRPTNRAALR